MEAQDYDMAVPDVTGSDGGPVAARMAELRAQIVELLDELIAEHLDPHIREENPIGITLALMEIQRLADGHPEPELGQGRDTSAVPGF